MINKSIQKLRLLLPFFSFVCCIGSAFAKSQESSIFEEGLISRDTLSSGLIMDMKRINLKNYPTAFNPSLIMTEQGLLFSFRHQPLLQTHPFISNIYLVLLDENFNPKGAPQILNTRNHLSKVPSQSEDARLFYFQNELWVIYNDNTDAVWGSSDNRRDMFIAKIGFKNGLFSISAPLKIIHGEKWFNTYVQKNWMPFEWEGNLLISYSLNPHEVLHVDLNTGICEPLFKTSRDIVWSFGGLRPGTPTVTIENEYFALFHSSKMIASPYSRGKPTYHYFMGAYAFSNSPPFELTRISKFPILDKILYNTSTTAKKVVFPGGIVVKDNKVYVAMGKDDEEIWIITLDKEKLNQSMIPLEKVQY